MKVEPQSGEIYLFAFYRKGIDCSMEINVAEEVPFKGVIYRDLSKGAVEMVFKTRFHKFRIEGKNYYTHFYVQIAFAQRCKTNLFFNALVKNKRKLGQLREEPKSKKNRQILRKYTDFIGSIYSDIDQLRSNTGYSDYEDSLRLDMTFVSKNRKAVSVYRDSKSSKARSKSKLLSKRIQSACISRVVQQTNRQTVIMNNICRKENTLVKRKIMNFYLKRKYFQSNWIALLRTGSVFLCIIQKFSDRLKDIERIHYKVLNARTMKDLLDAKEILRIPRSNMSKNLILATQTLAKYIVGQTFKLLYNKFGLKVKTIGVCRKGIILGYRKFIMYYSDSRDTSLSRRNTLKGYKRQFERRCSLRE